MGKGNLILSPSTTLLVRFGENINGLSGSGIIDSPASTTKGLTVGNNDVTSQFDGVIQNGTGAIAPTKVGTGTLTLTGASIYSGATTIQNGAVQISGANDRLPTGAAVTLGSATPTSGKLILGDVTSARNQTIATLTTTGAGTANAVVGGNPSIATLTITNTSSYGGFLGGAGANENNLALTVPSGTLTLSGNNTYIGNTTINLGGTISIGGTVATPFGGGTLTLSGGTLTTSANRSVTTALVTNAINLTADSAITTSSTAAAVDLNLSSSSISGSAGTLTFRNDAASGTGVFQPRLSASFTFVRPLAITNGSFGTTVLQSFNTSGNDQVFNGIISGSGSYKRTATTSGTGGNTIFTAANTGAS